MTQTITRSRLLGAALAVLAAACAQSNGDINRVQPNVVKKADLLDGIWYFRNTVTWTPATTNFTYPGQTGNVEKLVFEIQENNLVGYRAYPYILGAENNIDANSKVAGTTAKYCDKAGTCVGGQQYWGAPVVAFPIESHFDIQRSYNPSTGEQGNTIVENSSDRPWNQREFIRVNWSANILNQASGLNWGTVQNPSGGSSSGTWIQPNEKGESPEDWPAREYDQSGKLTYFDYTGRYMANPDTYYFEDWGYVPLCYLSFQNDCSSSEIRMRISFARIDPKKNRDFEPLVYDNDVMSKFGYFRTERLNYDRRYGYTNSAVVRLANHFRTWQESYQKDADGNPDITKPIALKDRQPKPIVYYFTRADLMGGTENYQRYLKPAKEVLEKDYSRAFRRAAATAQGKSVDQVGAGFILCENPVPAGAPAECGKEGFSPKFGDLRYSFMNTVAEPVANGLLGYGPSSADPETGEIISANANTYLWGVDLYGRSVLDNMDFLLGKTSEKDFISGKVSADYIKANPVYQTRDVLQKVKNGLVQSELSGIPTGTERSLGAFERLTARSQALVANMKAAGGVSKSGRNELRAAADVLAQFPQLESAVIDNPEFRNDLLDVLPAAVRTRAENDPNFLRQAARRLLTDGSAISTLEKARIDWANKNNITLAEFYDSTLYGLALRENQKRDTRMAELTAKGNPKCANTMSCTAAEAKLIANAEITERVSQNVWLATSEHEIGHTFGLRHNFQGSFDSVNYFDDYWQLRKTTLTVTDSATNQTKVPRTPNDLVAAASGTQAQEAQGLHDGEYSSIMDYSAKINGDWHGIGKYDEAALLFVYSADSQPGYVEVFDGARRTKQDFPGSDGKLLTVTGAGLDLPLTNAQHTHPGIRNYTERFHYTTVPLHFGEGSSLDAVIADGVQKLTKRSVKRWADVKAERERVAKLIQGDPTIIDDPDKAAAAIGNAPLEVPYMFCTDDHVDGVLSCNLWDRGPDYYEMNRTKLEDYWNYYYQTHFRRDRAGFSGYGAIAGTLNTYSAVSKVYKHWVFELYGNATASQELRPHVKVDTQTQDYWTLAVLDGINNHLNVMAVPPAGLFMLRNLKNVGAQWDVISEGDDYDALNEAGKAKVKEYYASNSGATDFAELPRGLGRRMYSRYDFKSGFGFFNRMIEAGHYNDQVGAMIAAVQPGFEILGTDVVADQQRFNIPYYLTFKTELEKAFSAMWAKQEEYVRPIMYLTRDDADQVTHKPTLAWKRFVLGQDIVQGFNYPPDLTKACPDPMKPQPGCLIPTQNPGQANIQTTWTARIYSLYLGEALFRVNYDLDYAKQNQVYKLGGGEQQTVAAGYHLVEAQDVVTGARYAAIEKDGAAPNSTPAVKMVNIAREMQLMVQDPTRCPLPDYLAYVGYGCMRADATRNPSLVEDRRKYWTQIFQDQIRDLDLMRGMYQAYGRAF